MLLVAAALGSAYSSDRVLAHELAHLETRDGIGPTRPEGWTGVPVR